MKIEDLINVAEMHLEDSVRKTDVSGIEGVTFSVTFKKTPALEVKSTFIFDKGVKLEG